MLHSTIKYHGEQGERHGGTLHWPGVNGLPFLGEAPPNLKQNELEQLPVVSYACHQIFNLADKEESAVYAWVRDRIRNQLFVLDWIERHWDDEKKAMYVYIEWSQLYVQLPENAFLGSQGNGSPKQYTLK